MKRVERLGSVVFVTIMISLAFHLLAMSFNNWVETSCNTCNSSDMLGSWSIDLRHRCYKSSMASIFFNQNATTQSLLKDSFVTQICIPNQYLFPKASQYANICLAGALAYPDTVCSTGAYDKTACRCDYTSRTQTGLAMTILAAFSLGSMLFFSHLISFVKADYTLEWLIPLCFILLVLTVIFMIVTLGVLGTRTDEDVNELRYSWTLHVSTFSDVTLIQEYKESIDEEIKQKYSINIGWCFGMEILALQFTLVSLIIYALMVLDKKTSQPRK